MTEDSVKTCFIEKRCAVSQNVSINNYDKHYVKTDKTH